MSRAAGREGSRAEGRATTRRLVVAGLILAIGLGAGAARADTVLVQAGSTMKFRSNASDPGIGVAWAAAEFDDSGWTSGLYGVGYETAPPGAVNLLRTFVASGAWSIYSRARFNLADPAGITRLLLGADYDDGYVAWINGVEVFRSATMPAGTPAWNTNAGSHESSNGTSPNYGVLVDITARALPALRQGSNVLAIGVWNNGGGSSSDLVLVPRLSFALATTVTRGPYLQNGTPESLVVKWRTDAPVVGRVSYGDDPADLAATVDEAVATTEHAVTLTGLFPATRYYYAIGTPTQVFEGGDTEHQFTTSPAAGSRDPMRVWVLGDSGTGNSAARAVRDAYYGFAGGPRADMWLMLGDNAYPDGTDAQYQTAMFDMYPEMLRRTVLWSTIGNHDGISANSATQTGPYYNIFTLPRQGEAGGLPSGTEAYYSFDYGNVHFICLDSNGSDRRPGSAMLTWLEEDALSTRQDWTVAFWHHPPYSKGSHNSDTETELFEMRQYALPILERAGVDLVLGGHSHSYERTFLLDGHYGASSTFDESMKKDGGDGRPAGDGAYRKPTLGPAAHEGAVYVVAGTSGQTSGGTLNHPAMFLSLNVLGSLVLDIGGSQLQARFLDSAGAVRDALTIVKGPAAVPEPDFSGSPRSGTAPLQVAFADASTGEPSEWAWDFDGDGAADSVERNPTFLYAAAGLYEVRLTAGNALGQATIAMPAYVCVTSSDGAADADGDGSADGADLCPCVADSAQVDTDGDGMGDACDADDDGDGVDDVADCAPLEPAVSRPPGMVGDTLALEGQIATILRWLPGDQATASNVYRGTFAVAAPFAHNLACFDAGVALSESGDSAIPSPGEGYYYLVGARNACGDSALTISDGFPLFTLQPCP